MKKIYVPPAATITDGDAVILTRGELRTLSRVLEDYEAMNGQIQFHPEFRRIANLIRDKLQPKNSRL